jgi:glycerol-3-phosphate acyltransferase PlsY
VFAYRAYAQQASAGFILYGVGACILLLWTLRPNIRRLLRGEERVIGWRARRMKQAHAGETPAKGR